MEKILSEHIALTPIQAFLESESWGFYRGVSTSDNLNCCINADYAEGKDKVGGLLTEDALSADILMSMAFIEPEFISGLLKKCGWSEDTERKKYEVVGVQSNFWYPQLTLENLNGDSEDNHLRLAQPDGWIAGENLLVMIEAKGMRDGAAFNYAQLAKEYLIAKQECDFREISQPRILLLLTKEQIGKIGEKGGLVKLFEKSWEELTATKEVNGKWSKNKVEFFQKDNIKKLLEDYKPRTDDEITSCFKMLSYESLEEYAKNHPAENESSKKLAAMIANTIAWHTPEVDREETKTFLDKKTKKITHYKPSTDKPSIWSKMLMDLAAAKTPLYEFYTGGTINKIVTDAEDEFFKQAEIPENNPIRQAVEEVREAVLEKEETIKDFYRLYRIQKYWDLAKENKKADKSDTVKYNFEYFEKKYREAGEKSDAKMCRKQLNEAFNALNQTYKEKLQFGDQTGIVPAAQPNVRYLLYFYVRSLMGFCDAMPGYAYFGFDNKKFFVKK